MVARTKLALAVTADKTYGQKILLPPNVRKAIQALNKLGFANVRASMEDGRHVITVVSSKEMFNANMKAIVDIGETGILLRCRTNVKPRDYLGLFNNMN